ncbi:zinc finger protein interacting with ribonucleoprotein K isoform X2 [Bactrocera oleae]|uniref:zinc finger protein interacting with ribonucleoprotein K isoform X2 n=1 Tax=Bactrocera oleae TaxID=104688 RepID=UPI0006B856FF|nr:zinc finger protein 2 homolog isoform X2 [Bactrocera oleae]
MITTVRCWSDFTNESLEFDDMEVLKALEDSGNADDCNEVIEDCQYPENTFTNGESECGYAGNAESLSTEISLVTTEVDKQTTNDAEQTETIEQSSASSNASFRQVVQHHKTRDGEERKYKCKFCDQAFATAYILRKHERRHSNNKPFSCSKCTKRFFTPTELNTHIRWHTGERPFVCTFCGNSYTTNGALNIHEKRHIGERKYKCDHCEKSFYEAFHLRQHSVVHTREKNYTCDQCQAKFTRSTALRMHKKLHENALRYICKVCKMRFNQRPTLIWHEKSKHAILRGGVASSIITETNPSKELPDIENTKYKYACCDIEFEDNDSFLKHQNDAHAVEAIATLETLEASDSEYVEFI